MAVAEGTTRMQRIHGFPNVSVNADRSTTVPGFVVSSPPPSTAFLLPYLLMWLSPRLPHHRAACAEVGVLGARGFALEWTAGQVCREGGGRVSTKVMVRNLDIERGNPTDARRLEIVMDGLLFDGAQFAMDTMLVSPLKRDGSARRRAADHNGVEEARRKKDLSRGSWG